MIPHLRPAVFAAVLAGAALAGTARADIRPADGQVAAGILDALDHDDWATADAIARRAGTEAARDLASWVRLASGDGTWTEYAAFAATRPDWPRYDRIRGFAERSMPGSLSNAAVLAFFDGEQPRTGTGALRLARAHLDTGKRIEAENVLIHAWTHLPLTPGEQADFRARYPHIVRNWSSARLDHMIWEGEFSNAEATYPLVSPDQVALGRARIGLRRDQPGIDALIDAVPANLRDDPGLAYDRMQWRMRRDRWDDAADLMLAQSSSAIALGRPAAWADRRLSLAHNALRKRDAARAYRIAADHRIDRGSDFEQLEWFAGWVALRWMNDPARARQHFRVFLDHVDTPISRGRAGYWLGRAEEALGNRSAAREAYALAAEHQTSFYGQLAAERAGIAPDPALAGANPGADWRRARFMQRSIGQIALMMHYAGESGRVWQFLVALAQEEDDPAELAAISAMAMELGEYNVAVRTAKIAAAKGVVALAPYYPLPELAQMRGPLKPELALAIARQESEFNSNAVSPVGARGLMQLMPATARKVSGELGIGYSPARLTSDWHYNATLGQTYLLGLLRDLQSIPLSAAGYNAGPHRVTRWIEEYGDPRGRDADTMIDWIETIPFGETRNYVMRVMEGMQVYRSRVAGRALPSTLTEDLVRRP